MLSNGLFSLSSYIFHIYIHRLRNLDAIPPIYTAEGKNPQTFFEPGGSVLKDILRDFSTGGVWTFGGGNEAPLKKEN
jgi:hypothetical protein